ncbi:MAG: hypothetical protein M1817_002267 [Caeruleum heppii]|nr:MAG: hypothetical protein M1817_002267 [Caeruleum heppii]
MSSDLSQLARDLVKNGPHKQEATSRRVRALFNRIYVSDTTEAHHVWEHPYFPQFYVPVKSIKSGLLKKSQAVDKIESAFLASIQVDQRATDRVLLFEKGPLAGLVRMEFRSMGRLDFHRGHPQGTLGCALATGLTVYAADAWFEEEQEVYGHPKDPYKRVDILPSSRTVTVSIEGKVIAESSNVTMLLETTLPTRYYLPKISVNWDLLTPSSQTSLCPYKGVAEYYHVTVNGKQYKDVIWWYRYPTAESIPITGRICGYNEKLDISIDGVLQDRPKTKFG